jgi:hypothetical protein
MKILSILDGLFNQLIPFVRWLISRFKKTSAEQNSDIDKQIIQEREQAKKEGRPKWGA